MKIIWVLLIVFALLYWIGREDTIIPFNMNSEQQEGSHFIGASEKFIMPKSNSHNTNITRKDTTEANTVRWRRGLWIVNDWTEEDR